MVNNRSFVFQKGEAISLVAATAASKLAAVEDVGPKRPDEDSPKKIASVKVSPATRATLQSLKLNKTRLNAIALAKTYRDVETITGTKQARSTPLYFSLGISSFRETLFVFPLPTLTSPVHCVNRRNSPSIWKAFSLFRSLGGKRNLRAFSMVIIVFRESLKSF